MKVMIGVPAGRGNLSSTTVSSIITATQIFNLSNVTYELATVSHAVVSTARNILATLFLNGSADVFMGIDDDVGVSQEVIELFFRSNHDFIAAYLPQRSMDLSAYENAIIGGLRGQEARRKAAPLVGPRSPQDSLSNPGIREVEWIGTGFYVLKKEVLKTMISKGVASPSKTTQANFSGNTYNFFDNISTPQQFLSEDLSFCYRLRKAGYRVYAYAGPGVSHTGSMTFTS